MTQLIPLTVTQASLYLVVDSLTFLYLLHWLYEWSADKRKHLFAR